MDNGGRTQAELFELLFIALIPDFDSIRTLTNQNQFRTPVES